MYAIVRTGGKQYRVRKGQTFEVEQLAGEIGDSIELTDVLLHSDGTNVTIGTPVVQGSSVTARITGQHKGRKIEVFRYKPKKRVRVRRGHRQRYTRLQVEGISGPAA